LPLEKVDDIKNDGWDVKERFYYVGCDPALLKSESEALPPPHETIPTEVLKWSLRVESKYWLQVIKQALVCGDQ
jgi:hypothetical protein